MLEVDAAAFGYRTHYSPDQLMCRCRQFIDLICIRPVFVFISLDELNAEGDETEGKNQRRHQAE